MNLKEIYLTELLNATNYMNKNYQDQKRIIIDIGQVKDNKI